MFTLVVARRLIDQCQVISMMFGLGFQFVLIGGFVCFQCGLCEYFDVRKTRIIASKQPTC